MKKTYYAAIEQDGTTYGLLFADLEGLIISYDNMDILMEGAEQAVEEHLAAYAFEKRSIPEASNFEVAIKKLTSFAQEEELNILGYIGVTANVPTKKERVNITIDEALLTKIKEVTRNRSAFIERAVRHELERG